MNNPEEIFMKLITTPEHPDPAEQRHFIHDENAFYGHDYVFLEDATRNALCEIAHEQGRMVDGLCCDIDLNFAHSGDFAQAARLYVARYLAGIPDTIELPGNFRSLSELRHRRSLQ